MGGGLLGKVTTKRGCNEETKVAYSQEQAFLGSILQARPLRSDILRDQASRNFFFFAASEYADKL
jgi:hypothetical protein